MTRARTTHMIAVVSDHISGPRALAEPIADITDFYAFPSPDRPGRLVLVMNTLPFAPPTTRFSDGLLYRFRVRPLKASPRGAAAPFEVEGNERTVDCVFSPSSDDDRVGDSDSGTAQPTRQTGTLTTPAGRAVTFE